MRSMDGICLSPCLIRVGRPGGIPNMKTRPVAIVGLSRVEISSVSLHSGQLKMDYCIVHKYMKLRGDDVSAGRERVNRAI